ncbi:MAG: hypothetical protein JKY70_06725 [Mucilaginibacter sp.]|nr:hypothetical protein [Mucilaginibacter sp.]
MKQLLLMCVCLLLILHANAQDTNPKFKSLTYITYEIEAGKAVIKDIMEIDNIGKVRYQSVWYEGIADTTYQLSSERIAKLNAIFNGERPLKSFMIKNKLEKGSHFAGPYEYVNYTLPNGKAEEFTIASIFMSETFNDAVDRLAVSPSKIAREGKTIKRPLLQKKILLSEKRSTYLPKIEEPPTVKDLSF